MKYILEKLFGANWKVALSQIGVAVAAILTTLAALPYTLGDIATIIPPAWKAKVVTIGIIAAFALRVLNGLQQKDKNVTGGTVQQTSGGCTASYQSHENSSAVIETKQAVSKP